MQSIGIRAHLGQFSCIVAADNGIGDAQAADVALHALQPLRVDFIGKHHAGVAHECRNVCRFATWTPSTATCILGCSVNISAAFTISDAVSTGEPLLLIACSGCCVEMQVVASTAVHVKDD